MIRDNVPEGKLVRYGTMPSERIVEENTACRAIVREVANYGVTQRQQLLLIYLLALELEDIEHMKAVTSLVRELGGKDLLLIGAQAPDGEA